MRTDQTSSRAGSDAGPITATPALSGPRHARHSSIVSTTGPVSALLAGLVPEAHDSAHAASLPLKFKPGGINFTGLDTLVANNREKRSSNRQASCRQPLSIERTIARMPVPEDSSSRSRDDFKMTEIAYLLIQFVDIHGSPKVKLVPASTLAGGRRNGRGFRRRGRLGHGPGPPFARSAGTGRPGKLYAVALRARRRPVRGGSLRRRRASSVLSSRQSQARAGTRPGEQGYRLQCRHRARVFPGREEPGRLDPRLGPSSASTISPRRATTTRAFPALLVFCAS